MLLLGDLSGAATLALQFVRGVAGQMRRQRALPSHTAECWTFAACRQMADVVERVAASLASASAAARVDTQRALSELRVGAFAALLRLAPLVGDGNVRAALSDSTLLAALADADAFDRQLLSSGAAIVEQLSALRRTRGTVRFNVAVADAMLRQRRLANAAATLRDALNVVSRVLTCGALTVSTHHRAT
jgi:hypothetical protein